MERPSHSHVQNRILLFMEHHEVDSLAELGRELGAHRSSVSRAMHALQDMDLVTKDGQYWRLTSSGNQEAQRIREQLPARAKETLVKIGRLVDQRQLSISASRLLEVDAADPLATIPEVATSAFGAVAQEIVQALAKSTVEYDSLALARESMRPLVNAVARIDLLASTEEAIRSVTSITAELDSLARESRQPLMRALAVADLSASAQETMESVAGVAAKLGSPTDMPESTRLLIDSAAKLHSFASAKEAIQPLVDAASRFDSIAMAQIKSAASVQEVIQPLVKAASVFDSVLLAQEALKSIASTTRSDQLPRLLDGQKAYSQGVAALRPSASLSELSRSPQFTAMLDSIKSVSLKPTIAEIAASRALQIRSHLAQSLPIDLGPRLAQEALSSLSQSQQLTLSLIEQAATCRNVTPSLAQNLGQASLYLRTMMDDLASIKTQGFAFGAATASLAALMPNVAGIARTYRGYFADIVGELSKSLADRTIDLRIAIPTRTTSTYIGSVRAIAIANECGLEQAIAPSRSLTGRYHEFPQLDGVLHRLGPSFVTMWRGSWATLNGGSPDRIRQAAHSGRELLMQALERMAPDSAFSATELKTYGRNGRATREMRVRKALTGASASTVSWADAAARALEETYNRLAAVSHDRGSCPPATERQLAGLLHALGGLLCFMEGCQGKHHGEREQAPAG